MTQPHSVRPIIGITTATKANVDINLHDVIRLERGTDGTTVFCLKSSRRVEAPALGWEHLMERLYEGMNSFAWEPRAPRGPFDHRE